MAEEAVNDRKPISDTVGALITLGVAILMSGLIIYVIVQRDKREFSERGAYRGVLPDARHDAAEIVWLLVLR